MTDDNSTLTDSAGNFIERKRTTKIQILRAQRHQRPQTSDRVERTALPKQAPATAAKFGQRSAQIVILMMKGKDHAGE